MDKKGTLQDDVAVDIAPAPVTGISATKTQTVNAGGGAHTNTQQEDYSAVEIIVYGISYSYYYDGPAPTIGGSGGASGGTGDGSTVEGTPTTLPPSPTAKTDCMGVRGGTAYFDNCHRCVGGTSELIACRVPCDLASKKAAIAATALFSDTSLKSRIDSLADPGAYTGERSIFIEKNTTTGKDTASNIAYPAADGPNNRAQAPNITMPGFTPIATVHTHPDGIYSVPSVGDFFNLAPLTSKLPNYTTTYVLAADGSKYAMTITNPALYKAFLDTYPAASNFDTAAVSFTVGTPLQIAENLAYETSYNNGNGLSQDASKELAMAYVLNKFNSGVELMKADASGNFHEISATIIHNDMTNTDVYSENTCN